jgi:serine/threonine protein kinase
LDKIAETLNEVTERVETHELADMDTGVSRLNNRYEQLRNRAESTLEATIPTSESIPSPQRQSLSYRDIGEGERIGSGGNADVYHVSVQTASGPLDLAVKEPRGIETLTIKAVAELLAEAERWQKLDNHDHIVSVVDYGSEPLPWIAMEYMDAGHLGERAGNLEFEQALWTAVGITKAVRHAHRRGVAHLDLKPENVLFQSVEEAWDVPKIADWGLSKHLLEHSKSIEGMSPHYAAPEQFEDEYGAADDITDVYQLGAVCYELFTGRPPFEGRPAKVINKVLNHELTPPSEIADVPEQLDDILLRALSTDKDDRYESVLYLKRRTRRATLSVLVVDGFTILTVTKRRQSPRQCRGVNSSNDAVEVVVEAEHRIDGVSATQRDSRRICETQLLVVEPLEEFDGIVEDCRRDPTHRVDIRVRVDAAKALAESFRNRKVSSHQRQRDCLVVDVVTQNWCSKFTVVDHFDCFARDIVS